TGLPPEKPSCCLHVEVPTQHNRTATRLEGPPGRIRKPNGTRAERRLKPRRRCLEHGYTRGAPRVVTGGSPARRLARPTRGVHGCTTPILALMIEEAYVYVTAHTRSGRRLHDAADGGMRRQWIWRADC